MADGWAVSGWGGTLTSGGGGGGGSAIVSNYQPAAGTPITPSTPLEFDVTSSPGTLVSLTVTVFYPATGASEVAYSRNGWGINYSPTQGFQGSERSSIAGGFHFKLRRRGGWYATPQVQVEGADSNGNPISQ